MCPNAESNPIYNSWLDAVDHSLVGEYSDSWQPPEDCGMVVSHLHYDFPTAALLDRITKENRFPVLVLADGILEYRNTFQNPQVATGSIFMPIRGHKLACIGESQARIVSAWGNDGKCEVVGLPRLDSVSHQANSQHPDEHHKSKPFRILVATARQPGFTKPQIESARQSLADLKKWFTANPTINGRPIKVTWRLTGELENAIGIKQDCANVESNQLIDVLKKIDAVITTPSTMILESWLHAIPTATLDYTNSPKFVSTAWNINSENQIADTISSMTDHPAALMLFQRTSLCDHLQTTEPAKKRMVDLIHKMIEIGIRHRNENTDLKFPASILAPPGATTSQPATLGQIFPRQTLLQVSDSESVATLFDQACRNIQQLHMRIDFQRGQLANTRQETRTAWRHHEYATDQVKWLRSEIQRLQLALRISNRQTRLQRRIRVRGSIAFQRWYFFVDQPETKSERIENSFSLDQLFELTGYPKSNKLPPTIRNFQTNKKRPPQIKMWKNRPTLSLLRKIKRTAIRAKMRVRVLRVMARKLIKFQST